MSNSISLNEDSPIIGLSDRYLENKHEFEWFIDKYFPNKLVILDEMAKDKMDMQLFSELNMIWFELPDHIFNIMNKPKGWFTFLSLIEY